MRRISSRLRALAAPLTLIALVGAALPAAAAAKKEVIYGNIPRLHLALPSLSFEGSGTSEIGSEVRFGGEARTAPTVQVDLSSFACQEGFGETCKTSGGQKYRVPITLNVYEIGAGDEVGPLILTQTAEFPLPYRPSANKKCPVVEGNQGFSKRCALFVTTAIRFRIEGFRLPEAAIVAVAWNTKDYGIHPTGVAGPADYLALDLNETQTCIRENQQTGECLEYEHAKPTVGELPFPSRVFANSVSEAVMCGEPLSPFRASGTCWEYKQPALEVGAEKA